MAARAILTAILLLASSGPAFAQQVSGITILSYGIYEANLKIEKKGTDGALSSARARNICHVMTTHIVPADDRRLFGIAYRVDGEPAGEFVAIRRVVRYPDQTKPGDGPEGYSTMEGTSRNQIGALSYGGWGIDENAKPGVWTAALFHGERKLLELSFTITKDKSFKVVPEADSKCFLVSAVEPRADGRLAER